MGTRSYNTRCKEILFISIKVTYYSLIILVIFAFGPTVQYSTVQPGVFTHDYSVLLTVPPSSPGKYIHGGRVGEGRGKKEEKSTTCLSQNQSTILVNCFILFYNTLYLITVHHIPLYILIIGWILHVYSTYTLDTRYFCSSQYIRYICIYTHFICIYILRHYCTALP